MKRIAVTLFMLAALLGSAVAGPVVWLGDSLTATRAPLTEADTFAHIVSASRGVAYVNKGVPSDTTTGMLARFSADVLAQNPSWLVIMTVNDAWPGNLVTLATSEANLRSMIEQSLRANIKVVIVTPPPVQPTTSDTYNAGWRANLPSYLAMQRKLASQYKIGFIDNGQFMAEAVALGLYAWSDLLIDGVVHQTAVGNTFIAGLFNLPQFSDLLLGADPASSPPAPSGTWSTIFGHIAPDGSSNGWATYTNRVAIAAANFSITGGTEFKVTVAGGTTGCNLTKMYEGPEGATSGTYDAAPTPVTFDSGSATKSIAANTEAQSDAITTSISATARTLFSMYSTGTCSFGSKTTLSGVQSYYNNPPTDAANQVGGTWYQATTLADVGITQVDLLH